MMVSTDMTLTADQPGGTASRAEDEIRAVLAEKASAIQAQDAARLVALYTPDIVVFDLAPPLLHPAAEVLDPSGKQAWFAGFEPGMGYESSDLTVTTEAGIAVCHALVQFSATPRGGSEGFTMWFRSTVCLRTIDGRWRISHEHESTPFHMDGSFRAAVELQP